MTENHSREPRQRGPIASGPAPLQRGPAAELPLCQHRETLAADIGQVQF